MLDESCDPRVEQYTNYVVCMQQLEFPEEDFGDEDDALGRLGRELVALAGALDRHYREQAHLLDVTERVNQGFFINEVMDHVYETFRPLIPYDRIGFALLEDDGTTLKAHWARADDIKIRLKNGYAQRLNGSSLNHVILTGEPRVINDLEAYYAANPKSHSTRLVLDEGIRSSLTCPLVALGKPLGFLFFSSREKGTYRNVHQHVFRRIAAQLSVIVEKSRLYEELFQINSELLEARQILQHQATHDGLTGLWNRKTIQDFMEEELARAKRSGKSAAAIMVDIDHFKELNDAHGHLAGDAVLREVARRFEEVARRGDTVGRYGGEEFLVVLAAGSGPGAESAAKRYLQQIAATPIEAEGRMFAVTVSLGVGIAEDSTGFDGDELLKLADDALYAAKRNGRNRIVVRSAQAPQALRNMK
ncbi:MAG: GGDEF domain-containing protein [Candidatus Hydrogenedentes bacterium]|nr:GGDEF domain-containing protein [Candidatus Hydrogenedentota bacterium]